MIPQHQIDRYIGIIGDREGVEIRGRDRFPTECGASQPFHQPSPVLSVEQHNRELGDFVVCTNVSASNSSSKVPKPPGSTTKPWAYLTNIVLRAKK